MLGSYMIVAYRKGILFTPPFQNRHKMEWHKNGTVIIAHFILVCYVDTPQRPPQGAFEIPPPQPFAGVSQLARESGSYPECHWFESDRRYQQNRSGCKTWTVSFLSDCAGGDDFVAAAVEIRRVTRIFLDFALVTTYNIG